MDLVAGTYNLGQLRDLEVVEASSAAVIVSVGGTEALNETLYASSDGKVHIANFGDLIRPFITVGESASVSVSVDGTAVVMTVDWNLLGDDGTPTKSYGKTFDGPVARTFNAMLADGTIVSIPVYGVETESAEIERTTVSVNGVESVVLSHLYINHKIDTRRLNSNGIRLLTGLAASNSVSLLSGDKIVIDVDADIAKTVNDPLEDRTASITWRYADVSKAESEYDSVPALCDAKQSASGWNKTILYSFVYIWNGSSHTLKVYGTDKQTREFSGEEILDSTIKDYDTKDLSIEHVVTTGRMSRVELRALVCLMASTSVTLNEKPVVVDVSDVEISSDPESERTASLTWRYADASERLSSYE